LLLLLLLLLLHESHQMPLKWGMLSHNLEAHWHLHASTLHGLLSATEWSGILRGAKSIESRPEIADVE
jgi:hypothetical protein